MLSLALATVRTRWAGFAGAFLALVLGTAVIAMMALTLGATFGTPHPGPQRFAAAPAVVVPADPRGDRARPPASLPDRTVAAVAATGRVTADRSFPVTVSSGAPGGPSSGGRSVVGHGWSAAGLGRYRLVAGRAPGGDGEVVLGGGAAELVGRALAVGTADGVRRYTVVGVTAPVWFEDAVFFGDRTAARLSPPVNALVAYAPPDRVRAAAGPGALVRTGDGRVVADPDPSGGAAALSNAQAMAGTTMVIAASVAMFIVIATFAFAVEQRRRELALLRLIGATPRQVRRTVLAEAAVVGAVASAVGCVLGAGATGVLETWMTGHGVAPRWFSIGLEPVAPACAFLAGTGSALLGAASAALRAARVRPAEAMRDAAVGRRSLTPVRVVLGVGMLAGAVVAGWVIARQAPETAVNPRKYGSVPLLFTGGWALLAPLVLPAAVRLATRPWTRRGAGALLVRQNMLNSRRRAAATMVPAVIAVGLVATMLCVQANGDRARLAQAREETRADRVVVPAAAGGRLDRPTLEALRAVPGVAATSVTPVRAYIGKRSGPVLDSLSAQAVAPGALGGVLRPRVVEGSLDGLGDDAVVIDRRTARSNGLALGERVVVRLPDGVPHELRIAAVVRTGLSGDTTYVSSALLPAGDRAGITPDRVLLMYRPGTDRAAVADRLAAALRGRPARTATVGDWFTAMEAGLREKADTAATVVLGVSVGYALISVANTLVMASAGRRREFAALGLTGATRAQVLRMAGGEALLAVGVGGIVAAGAGAAVLAVQRLSLDRIADGYGPAVPWGPVGMTAVVCAVVATGAAVLPVALPAARAVVRSVVWSVLSSVLRVGRGRGGASV
ncbi:MULTISPECIES: FtsX-like permease family protein [Streptomyces]|uniref:FtsX-like permease family protein n=1 Tax=Streptomyces TaxID=1883 RepID=UPI00163D1F7E|nr:MULTISPECIES: FtsX-like permease family protein [Streptomyces]MBC2875059.1 FtsX-like permease family protein [Streptomyces sp. TYQ1024]